MSEVRVIDGVEVETPTSFEEAAPKLVGVFACLGDVLEKEPTVLDLSAPSSQEEIPTTVEVVSDVAVCD